MSLLAKLKRLSAKEGATETVRQRLLSMVMALNIQELRRMPNDYSDCHDVALFAALVALELDDHAIAAAVVRPINSDRRSPTGTD